MSDQDDWDFAGADDAKAEIRAAVGYLLRGAIGGARGDIVQEIISIVRQVASGCRPSSRIPWMMVCQADSRRTADMDALIRASFQPPADR
jgi:hypothetical protein